MQSGLHCKVECNKEIRRFLFNGTEFGSLYEQIKNLFGIQREFVLKYKDEEGDLVTVSSSEELSFAVSSLMPSQALRLEVTLKEEQVAPVVVKTDKKACQRWGAGSGCGNRMEWKKKRMQGYLDNLQSMPENDWNREWRKKKIQHLQTKLACMESQSSAVGCAPSQGCGPQSQGCGPQSQGCGPQSQGCGPQNKAMNWQMKKDKLNAKIEKLSAIPPEEGNFAWRQKKIEHMKMKLSWMEMRQNEMQGCKKMSPEEKAKFDATKGQMKAIRENMCNLRMQIHQKKGEWHMAPKENKEAISKEIQALKEQMKAEKDKMCSLRSQMHC